MHIHIFITLCRSVYIDGKAAFAVCMSTKVFQTSENWKSVSCTHLTMKHRQIIHYYNRLNIFCSDHRLRLHFVATFFKRFDTKNVTIWHQTIQSNFLLKFFSFAVNIVKFRYQWLPTAYAVLIQCHFFDAKNTLTCINII